MGNSSLVKPNKECPVANSVYKTCKKRKEKEKRKEGLSCRVSNNCSIDRISNLKICNFIYFLYY